MSYAMSLAQRFGATVHLLHVYPIDAFVGPDGSMLLTPQLVRRITESALAQLDRLAEPHRARGMAVVTVVRDGTPSEEIVRYAESVGAGMLAIGTHGRTGLPRMFLGSVAERIVRTSPIPVVTVRLGSKLATTDRPRGPVVSREA